MKMNKYLTLPLIAAGLSVSVAGMAADNDSSSHQERSQALFKTLDANGDGQLSAAELTQLPDVMRKHHFDKLDANKDGKIEQSEYEASAKKRADHRFKRLDKNGDGSVSADEMQAAMAQRHAKKANGHDKDGKKHMHHHRHWRHAGHHHHGMPRTDYIFARMDRNNDGYVSEGEWNQAVQKWQARHSRFKQHASDSGQSK